VWFRREALEPTVQLIIDVKARHRISHHKAGQAILITILSRYGMPSQALVVESCHQQTVTADPDLVLLTDVHGVPIYAHRRVATFIRWHPLCLTVRGPGWWPAFAIVGGDGALDELARWEQGHPGLAVLERSPAA
jgi:hypothetical protein